MTMYGPYPGLVLNWHDGDTCHLELDLGFGYILSAYDLDNKPVISARIWGINAPELNTDPGKDSKAHAEALAPPGTKVMVLSHGWDKYGGRFDASIELPDGTDFGARMIEEGYAVELKV